MKRFPGYPIVKAKESLNPSQLLPGWFPLLTFDLDGGGSRSLMFDVPKNVRYEIGNSSKSGVIGSQVPYHSLSDGVTPTLPVRMDLSLIIPSSPKVERIENRMKHPGEKWISPLTPPASGSQYYFDNIGMVMWFERFCHMAIDMPSIDFYLFYLRWTEPGPTGKGASAGPLMYDYNTSQDFFPDFPDYLTNTAFYFDEFKMNQLNEWETTLHIIGQWPGGHW